MGFVVRKSLPSLTALIGLLLAVGVLAVYFIGAPIWFPAIFAVVIISPDLVIQDASGFVPLLHKNPITFAPVWSACSGPRPSSASTSQPGVGTTGFPDLQSSSEMYAPPRVARLGASNGSFATRPQCSCWRLASRSYPSGWPADQFPGPLEDGVKGGLRQLAGEGVLLAGVERTDERETSRQLRLGQMTELRPGANGEHSAHRVMSELPEDHDNPRAG